MIIHWTGGGPSATVLDREHYHYIVEQSGRLVKGVPVEANADPLDISSYAAHTRSFNTDSIGFALTGMVGAEERPFKPGRFPLTQPQTECAWQHAARILKEHGLPVTTKTCFTHAEAEPLHGVEQWGKWDITWLPGMIETADPVVMGDIIRSRIQNAMLQLDQREARKAVDAPESQVRELSWMERLLRWINKRTSP